MPFVAECIMCRQKVRVPDRGAGASVQCPRCKSYFTAAAESNLFPTASRRASVASALASGERAAVPPARADAQGAAVAMPLAQRESGDTTDGCRDEAAVPSPFAGPDRPATCPTQARSARRHRFAGR